MERREMCAYCAKWNDGNNMTPLYEEGKTLTLHYCDTCLPTVKDALKTLPWNKVYHFGKKGEVF